VLLIFPDLSLVNIWKTGDDLITIQFNTCSGLDLIWFPCGWSFQINWREKLICCGKSRKRMQRVGPFWVGVGLFSHHFFPLKHRVLSLGLLLWNQMFRLDSANMSRFFQPFTLSCILQELPFFICPMLHIIKVKISSILVLTRRCFPYTWPARSFNGVSVLSFKFIFNFIFCVFVLRFLKIYFFCYSEKLFFKIKN